MAVRFNVDCGDGAVMAERGFELRAGEHEVGTFFANHVQGFRGYGGRLSITSQRLVFIPVALSQANGGRPAEFDVRQLLAADVSARFSGPHDPGRLRRRLQVRTQAGDPEYFVVWRPRKLADLINGLVTGSHGRR
jgi:hypothetical protein